MGLGPSKCCKSKIKESEKTPLTEAERGDGGLKAAFSGRDKNGRDTDAPSPIDPDPGVFYAKPASKTSSRSDRSDERRRGRGRRDKSRGRRDKNWGRNGEDDRELDQHPNNSPNKHHRKSSQRVGEERILKYHRDHPDRAPLLGSSSEEEYDEEGHSVGTSKTWIGVCPAKLQHRVWWWSVTFILCFILVCGVFLGFAHSFSPEDDSGVATTDTDDAHNMPSTAHSTSSPNTSSTSASAARVDASSTLSETDSDAVAERNAVNAVKQQLDEKTGELKNQVEELEPEPPIAKKWEAEEEEEEKEEALEAKHHSTSVSHEGTKEAKHSASKHSASHAPPEATSKHASTHASSHASSSHASSTSSSHLTKRGSRNSGDTKPPETVQIDDLDDLVSVLKSSHSTKIHPQKPHRRMLK